MPMSKMKTASSVVSHLTTRHRHDPETTRQKCSYRLIQMGMSTSNDKNTTACYVLFNPLKPKQTNNPTKSTNQPNHTKPNQTNQPTNQPPPPKKERDRAEEGFLRKCKTWSLARLTHSYEHKTQVEVEKESYERY
jgi:hypothetical protein